MFTSKNWKDYALLDASDGERLERWGKYILIRPDPSIIWKGMKKHPAWKRADAVYSRSSKGGGNWEVYKLPAEWQISYTDLDFIVRPTGFKHTGIFPEQASNWDFCGDLIEKAKAAGKKDIRILNLFAYTGAQTLACSAHGADEVVHVDASKGMIARAKENIKASRQASGGCRKACYNAL